MVNLLTPLSAAKSRVASCVLSPSSAIKTAVNTIDNNFMSIESPFQPKNGRNLLKIYLSPIDAHPGTIQLNFLALSSLLEKQSRNETCKCQHSTNEDRKSVV